jgi:MFS family permease
LAVASSHAVDVARTRIPQPARVAIAGDAVAALGTGLILPVTLIYLHQVRGIRLPVVGALLAMQAAVGLVAVPFSGALLDRIGARRVLAGSLIGQAAGTVGLAWTHSVLTAIPVMVIFGGSMAPRFPAFMTLLAGLCPRPDEQQRAFAMNFTVLNAGIGIGGVIGAAVASVHNPASFQALFVGNSVCCLLFTLVLTKLPESRPPRSPQDAKAGYREVLANRPLRAVVIATLVLAFTGYAALDAGLPAFATVEAHAPVRVVALALTANTTLIVVAQLFVLRLVRALRRSRALAMIGLIWAVSWAVFGLAGLGLPYAARIACIMGFAALFGLGETLMAPTISPLVNSLADDATRGRANALSTGVYSLAFVISPTISTTMIAAGVAGLWIGLLCAGCLATVGIGFGIGRRLTAEQDRISAGPGRQADGAHDAQLDGMVVSSPDTCARSAAK